MKKYLLIHILFFTSISFAQKKDTMDLGKMNRQIDSSMKELDSINARINNSYKSMDSAYMQRQIEQNNKNLDAFMAMQREREAKQKRSNWIRLGIGLLFLGVLIFGVRRRNKNQHMNK
jgi:superfamily II RNA helicase